MVEYIIRRSINELKSQKEENYIMRKATNFISNVYIKGKKSVPSM
jgi:hypothetical protein